MTPDGTLCDAHRVAPNQRHHRLRPHELERLTANYQSGLAVNDLAAQYGINRYTVIEHMRRQGVPRRYPRLGEAEVREAISFYYSGDSLAKIGKQMHVDAGTVGRAPAQGWRGAARLSRPEALNRRLRS
jgi:dsRNA-specific ribonuclease